MQKVNNNKNNQQKPLFFRFLNALIKCIIFFLKEVYFFLIYILHSFIIFLFNLISAIVYNAIILAAIFFLIYCFSKSFVSEIIVFRNF